MSTKTIKMSLICSKNKKSEDINITLSTNLLIISNIGELLNIHNYKQRKSLEFNVSLHGFKNIKINQDYIQSPNELPVRTEEDVHSITLKITHHESNLSKILEENDKILNEIILKRSNDIELLKNEREVIFEKMDSYDELSEEEKTKANLEISILTMQIKKHKEEIEKIKNSDHMIEYQDLDDEYWINIEKGNVMNIQDMPGQCVPFKILWALEDNSIKNVTKTNLTTETKKTNVRLKYKENKSLCGIYNEGNDRLCFNDSLINCANLSNYGNTLSGFINNDSITIGNCDSTIYGKNIYVYDNEVKITQKNNK